VHHNGDRLGLFDRTAPGLRGDSRKLAHNWKKESIDVQEKMKRGVHPVGYKDVVTLNGKGRK